MYGRVMDHEEDRIMVIVLVGYSVIKRGGDMSFGNPRKIATITSFEDEIKVYIETDRNGIRSFIQVIFDTEEDALSWISRKHPTAEVVTERIG